MSSKNVHDNANCIRVFRSQSLGSPLLKVHAFSMYGTLAASNRYRFSQYVEGLRDFGIELSVSGLLTDRYLQRKFDAQSPPLLNLAMSSLGRLRETLIGRADVLIVHLELYPLLPFFLEKMLLKKPFVFDFDDGVHLSGRSTRGGLLAPMLDAKTDRLIQAASAVTAGSRLLVAHASSFNANTRLLPTVVDTTHYVPSSLSKSNVFTIGWIGSPSTAPYLEMIVPALSKLAQQINFRLVVIGGKAPVLDGIDVVSLPWAEDTEIALINTFDVGVMPLPDTPWARHKCAFKLIQYMACGVPVIGSAVGANIDVVTPDVGFLVNTPEEWLEAFICLYNSQALREQFGAAGRARVISEYSLASNIPKFSEAIYSATT